jgi:hypothetical protein
MMTLTDGGMTGSLRYRQAGISGTNPEWRRGGNAGRCNALCRQGREIPDERWSGGAPVEASRRGQMRHRLRPSKQSPLPISSTQFQLPRASGSGHRSWVYAIELFRNVTYNRRAQHNRRASPGIIQPTDRPRAHPARLPAGFGQPGVSRLHSAIVTRYTEDVQTRHWTDPPLDRPDVIANSEASTE